MAEIPALENTPASPGVPVSSGVIAYVLFALAAVMTIASSGLPLIAPLVGVVGIIGVIVCYVKRNDARNTWLASHFTWLIRTFWWSLLWSVLGWIVLGILGWILIGIPIALAIWIVAGIWVIYRVVRGYLLFKDSLPIPGI